MSEIKKRSPFTVLAHTTQKELSVIEYQSGKAFARMVAKGFESGDMLVALAILYHSLLNALERQQPGLKLNTHEYMMGVFNEMAGLPPDNTENHEQIELITEAAE